MWRFTILDVNKKREKMITQLNIDFMPVSFLFNPDFPLAVLAVQVDQHGGPEA
jgi:hypothetical protein